jgi:hypothetical protein
MASLVTLPPSLLIIFIFRKSRIRKLRPSRIDEALKEKRVLQQQVQVLPQPQPQEENLVPDSGHGKKPLNTSKVFVSLKISSSIINNWVKIDKKN